MYMDPLEKRDFILSQLRAVPGTHIHEQYTMICCPFHSDTNPSGRISNKSGYFKCYGCGAEAHWNDLAPMIGAQPFTRKPVEQYVHELPAPVVKEKPQEKQLEFSALPKNKLWREIPTNLLIDVGCKLCHVIDGTYRSAAFIWMPVVIDKQLKGYIRGRMCKIPGKPSYINQAGPWTRNYGLFPFDYAMSKTINNSVVLVEGQRDALRLLSLGIPAMCILGTQNWSDSKARLLELHGVEHAYIFMDGDDAGIHGTEKVWSSLHNYTDCHVIKLWEMNGSPWLRFKDKKNPSAEAKAQSVDLWDPGNCPVEILHQLKHKLEGTTR